MDALLTASRVNSSPGRVIFEDDRVFPNQLRAPNDKFRPKFRGVLPLRKARRLSQCNKTACRHPPLDDGCAAPGRPPDSIADLALQQPAKYHAICISMAFLAATDLSVEKAGLKPKLRSARRVDVLRSHRCDHRSCCPGWLQAAGRGSSYSPIEALASYPCATANSGPG